MGSVAIGANKGGGTPSSSLKMEHEQYVSYRFEELYLDSLLLSGSQTVLLCSTLGVGVGTSGIRTSPDGDSSSLLSGRDTVVLIRKFLGVILMITSSRNQKPKKTSRVKNWAPTHALHIRLRSELI